VDNVLAVDELADALLDALEQVDRHPLASLGAGLQLGRNTSDDLVGYLGSIFAGVAEHGPNTLYRIRIKHWLRRMALDVNAELVELLLDRLAAEGDAPWPAVRAALEAI